jgi:hypothetical protein
MIRKLFKESFGYQYDLGDLSRMISKILPKPTLVDLVPHPDRDELAIVLMWTDFDKDNLVNFLIYQLKKEYTVKYVDKRYNKYSPEVVIVIDYPVQEESVHIEKAFADLGKKFYDIILKTGQSIKTYTSLDNAIKMAKLKDALQIFDQEDRSIVWSEFSLESKHTEDYQQPNNCKYLRRDTRQCRTGCSYVNVDVGDICPWEDSDADAKMECSCYKI